MSRPFTGTERSRLQGPYKLHVRVRTSQSDGSLVDVSSRFRKAEWAETVDATVPSGTLTLARDGPGGSLAPLIETSAYNLLGGAYSPLIDNFRVFTLDTAVTELGFAPLTTDWKGMIVGFYDNPASAAWDMGLPFRGIAGFLQDRPIEIPRVFGSDAGTALETVLQDMLDDYAPDLGVTLAVWTASGALVGPFTQKDGGTLWDALQTLVLRVGGSLRYRWQSDGTYQLTFTIPDRAASTPTLSLGPSEYLDVEQLDMPGETIRNAPELWYYDKAAKEFVRVALEHAGSIALYKRRWMRMVTDATSNVDTEAEALAMVTHARDDLAYPFLNQRTPCRWLWMLDLDDVIAYAPNAKHYNTTKTLAVVGLGYSIDGTADPTTAEGLLARNGLVTPYTHGHPMGAHKRWIDLAGSPPTLTPPPSPTFAPLSAEANPLGSSDAAESVLDPATWGKVWYEVTLDPRTSYVEVYTTKSQTTPVPLPSDTEGDKVFVVRRPDGYAEGGLAVSPDAFPTRVASGARLNTEVLWTPPWAKGAGYTYRNYVPTPNGWGRKVRSRAYGFDGQKATDSVDQIVVPGTAPTITLGIVTFTPAPGYVREGTGVRLNFSPGANTVPGGTVVYVIVERNGTRLAALAAGSTTYFDPNRPLTATDTYTVYQAVLAGTYAGATGQRSQVIVTVAPVTSTDLLWQSGYPQLVALADGRPAVRVAWSWTDVDRDVVEVQYYREDPTTNTPWHTLYFASGVGAGSGTFDDVAGVGGRTYKFLGTNASGQVIGVSEARSYVP